MSRLYETKPLSLPFCHVTKMYYLCTAFVNMMWTWSICCLIHSMGHLYYILLFLFGFGHQSYSLPNQPSSQQGSDTVASLRTYQTYDEIVSQEDGRDCSIAPACTYTVYGIEGGTLICTNGGSFCSATPTIFTCAQSRVHFGRNRTRTGFLRRMLHQCQSQFIIYHGIERLETSPFSVSVGRVYYIYALRHILC